ncbi:MAG: phosphate ABC transporter ATP-binding protein [Clostridia bacterium]|nr:phosphate ABC transporter ATP-binding protein [Clostridia bacterium]
MVEKKDREILSIAETNFAAGKRYAIIGPSGAGKTTLLRVLNLLQEPTRGQVLYYGQELIYSGSNRLAIQRTMSMVFQKPAMFSGDVFYNVALGLKLHGMAKKDIKGRVEEALEVVRLSHLAKQSALTLSGGEAQRVALARALVTRPKILLLDEPTANLDPLNVAIIEEAIKSLHTDNKNTIIMITHNLHQAKRLAEEVIYMNNGAIVEQGTVAEVLLNPKNKETQLFVSGEMVY